MRNAGINEMIDKIKTIGEIGNYYGSVTVHENDGRCYWAVENWDGYEWEEIPKTLFDELNKFEDAR